MIHLSDPAAYHDKRFKNNPAKRKTMKTPLPTPGEWLHERCGQKVYTESQLRAAMVAAWNEAIEDAARVCEDTETVTYTFGGQLFDSGCETLGKAIDAILKLKETP